MDLFPNEQMHYVCECMYLAAPYTNPHCAAEAYDAWLTGGGGGGGGGSNIWNL
jgi:hypothetical protein